jgi:hypothetical protein
MDTSLNHDHSLKSTILQRIKHNLTLAIIILVIFSSFFVYGLKTLDKSVAAPEISQYLSQQALEEKYGLQISLIGVTAMGGMVDFRMKIIDVHKAGELFSKTSQFPVLTVAGADTFLTVPQENQVNQELVKDKVYFYLFPNTANAVRPGSQVVVAFGDLKVGPVTAQ